jgi:hypothetical protein
LVWPANLRRSSGWPKWLPMNWWATQSGDRSEKTMAIDVREPKMLDYPRLLCANISQMTYLILNLFTIVRIKLIFLIITFIKIRWQTIFRHNKKLWYVDPTRHDKKLNWHKFGRVTIQRQIWSWLNCGKAKMEHKPNMS